MPNFNMIPGNIFIGAGQTIHRKSDDTGWEGRLLPKDKNDIGLSNVDNTSDANKPISTATQAAIDNKQDDIAPGTTQQYFRGDKSWQTLNKASVGLSNVDNTSDADKPVSTATQTALNAKLATADAATVATTGSYSDLTNKPTIPAAQVNTDWNATTGVSAILNKPTIPAAQVNADWSAVSGVSAILNKPTIPTVKRTETYLGTTDASGNYTITFSPAFASAPDVQPHIIGGTFNQFIRVVSVSTTGAVVQVAQRNSVTLLGIEVLLAATSPVSGASVTVQATAR